MCAQLICARLRNLVAEMGNPAVSIPSAFWGLFFMCSCGGSLSRETLPETTRIHGANVGTEQRVKSERREGQPQSDAKPAVRKIIIPERLEPMRSTPGDFHYNGWPPPNNGWAPARSPFEDLETEGRY